MPGCSSGQTVEETAEDAWDHLMAANVKSVLFCTKAALGALRTARGSVVNVASESGLNGYPETTAYCASKGAGREPDARDGNGVRTGRPGERALPWRG